MPKPRAAPSTEYVLKVALKDSKRIWRTIAVRGDQALDDLHEAIFAAFNRSDPHLYSFYFPSAPRGRKGVPTREYTSAFVLEDAGPIEGREKHDAAKTRMDELHLKVGERFEYLFDYGDYWLHEVSVVEIRPADMRAQRPLVLEKKGASPPQYPPAEE
jgi:hypothetical protein